MSENQNTLYVKGTKLYFLTKPLQICEICLKVSIWPRPLAASKNHLKVGTYQKVFFEINRIS